MSIEWIPHVDSTSPLTVSQLTDAIKSALNYEFLDLWVSGEISNLSRPQSGHIYLTIKDAYAQLSVIVWKSHAERLRFEPEAGMQILIQGGIDVYPQRGSYQLIARQVHPLGQGALQLAFRQMHDRLKQEGLFDQRHKKPIPWIPRRVAVITSPSGAAIQDFLHVIHRRWPHLEILIIPVKVQGPEAADEIVAALDLCGEGFRFCPDVIVVTRGGGSIEDLWAFNEERVVRAIFRSVTPVVSAVGHEVDVSLSDLVADQRALTPSEAAEKLVPTVEEVTSALTTAGRHLDRAIERKFDDRRNQFAGLMNRPALRQPLNFVRELALRLDSLETKLVQISFRNFAAARHRLRYSFDALKLACSQLLPASRLQLAKLTLAPSFSKPLSAIDDRRNDLSDLQRRLIDAVESQLLEHRQAIHVLEGQLAAFNPSHVLQRGFSLTVDETGRPLVDCKNVKPGDKIKTWLAGGQISSRVEATDPHLNYV